MSIGGPPVAGAPKYPFPEPWTACTAICWPCVDMGCDLRVSSIFPASKTLYPASPSLRWVPWAPVPHLADSGTARNHRYYDPLRLPKALLGLVRCSLSSTDTLRCPSFIRASARADLVLGAGLPPRTPGILGTEYSSDRRCARRQVGSPKFPSYPHEYMPWSQTPVVTQALAMTRSALLPSDKSKPSAFPCSRRFIH